MTTYHHPADPTLRPDARKDQGITLIEVMVAISILSLLMVMLTATIVHGMQLSRGMGVRLDNINQGQLGMNAATKNLRTAVLPAQLVDQVCADCGDTAIISATPTTITFYANLNNTGQGPSRTTYYIEKDPVNSYGNLIQTTQAPQTLTDGRYSYCVVGSAGCVVNKRAVARGLAWPIVPTTTPTFRYYDFNGKPIDANPLTTEDLVKVNSIDVTIKIQTNTFQDAAPSNTIVQRVELPNADINVLVAP
jgi:prepilin-type N-terminal cleavage/methylation domain-containing protein